MRIVPVTIYLGALSLGPWGIPVYDIGQCRFNYISG